MRCTFFAAMSLVLTPAVTAYAGGRPDVVLADFEAETYAPWTTTGEAFGPGPARGPLPGQMAVGDYLGDRLVNSFFHGDDSEGTLASPEFLIERHHVQFLIGGGRHPGDTALNLIVGGKVVRSATGIDSEYLRRKAWDVRDLEGRKATIEVVDRRKGRWGHINVDQIVLTDSAPAPVDERAELLAKADAADRVSAERAGRDLNRPAYHVAPPGNWINDPNGPIYYKGYYHLFYQHNPYGDGWGNMHWGHVRSKDLAHWEPLPTALWPSREEGEEHVFSGCATLDGDGRPIIFYTSIGGRLPEQWAAVPEGDDLISWKKHAANPILTEKLHGDVKISEWRDPYVFESDHQVYMVAGGNRNEGRGGDAVVNVYRAEDRGLTRWTYLGALFRHPDAGVKNIECPLFFPIGKKWVLIVSQGRPVQWFVGTLDAKTMRFTAERRGAIDAGNFYAPNATAIPDGRTLLWGWIPDFPAGLGWNGCLTLPRELTLSSEGDLISRPARELSLLRGERIARLDQLPLTSTPRKLEGCRGNSLEIVARISLGTAKRWELRLRASGDGSRAIPIAFDGQTLDVAGVKSSLVLPRGEAEVEIHAFLDRSVLEVYTSTGLSVSRVIAPRAGDMDVEAISSGGEATIRSLEAWPVRSLWPVAK